MPGATIDVSINDSGVKDMLRRVQARVRDMTPAFRIIGATVRTSIVRNFERQGRPTRWAPHSETTRARRGKDAMILRESSRLMDSIHPTAYPDRVEIGTNVVYAATHQFGAKRGEFGTVEANVKSHMRKLASGKEVDVRAHTRKMVVPWGDIPARPFLMVQDEDWDEIREELADFLTRRS